MNALLSRIARRFRARLRFSSRLSRSSQEGRRKVRERLRKKRNRMRPAAILARLLVVATLAGCAWDRPVHPLRLEGFPGAPIEPDLFPLRDGMRWEFEDVKNGGRPLVLELRAAGEAFELVGSREGAASLRVADGFVEILRGGELVDRPLKLEGRAGDWWKAAGARCTAFGYDRIPVLGATRRALVVAVERGRVRDLYWFAADMGWVRIRTERDGNAVRDARLKAFEAGRRVDAAPGPG